MRTPRGGGMFPFMGPGMRGAPWFQQLMWQRMMEQGGGDDSAEEQQDALERALEEQEEASEESSGSSVTSRAPVSVGSSASKRSSYSGGGSSGGGSSGGAPKPAAVSHEDTIPNGPEQDAIQAMIDSGADPESIKEQMPQYASYIDAVSGGGEGAPTPDIPQATGDDQLGEAYSDAATLENYAQGGTGGVEIDLEKNQEGNEKHYGPDLWGHATTTAKKAYDPESAILDDYSGLATDNVVDSDDPLERALANAEEEDEEEGDEEDEDE